MLDGGYRFGEQTTRVTAVEQQSRLVYVGNLPGEVPDATKRAFLLSPFSRLLLVFSQSSVTWSRVVKMSLAKQEKDIPSSGRITGFEVRISLYVVPSPARVFPICNGPGHRRRQCPLNLARVQEMSLCWP